MTQITKQSGTLGLQQLTSRNTSSLFPPPNPPSNKNRAPLVTNSGVTGVDCKRIFYICDEDILTGACGQHLFDKAAKAISGGRTDCTSNQKDKWVAPLQVDLVAQPGSELGIDHYVVPIICYDLSEGQVADLSKVIYEGVRDAVPCFSLQTRNPIYQVSMTRNLGTFGKGKTLEVLVHFLHHLLADCGLLLLGLCLFSWRDLDACTGGCWDGSTLYSIGCTPSV